MNWMEGITFAIVRCSAVMAAWLATYAIHSTVLLLVALVGGALLARVAPASFATREMLWKTVLLGSIVTATLQTAGIAVAGRRYDISRNVERLVWSEPLATPAANGSAANVAATTSYPARLRSPDAAVRFIPVVLVLAWIGYALSVLMRTIAAARRARRALGVRRPVTDDEILRDFSQLTSGFGVRKNVALTLVDGVSSPVVIGQSEICLPVRAVVELPADERRSVLAHELAHIARRDATWLLASAAIESLFFFQPLNRLVRSRLVDESEFLADELAARHGGSGLTLARSLARIAEWVTSTPERMLAPALLETRSSLVRRVAHLTSNRPQQTRMHRAAGPFIAVSPMAFVFILAPSVHADDVRNWGTPAFHWEGTVPNGKQIEVKTLMGDIRSEPWDGKTVVVNVTRHGRPTNPDVRFDVVSHDGGITICAVYPVPAGHVENSCEPGRHGKSYNTPSNDVETDFLVKLPRGVAFAAHSATGNIDAKSDAPVSAFSSTGNVTVRMGATAWHDTLDIGTNSGNIHVTLPDDANSIVIAESRTGSTRSAFPAIAGGSRGFFSRFRLHGSLGELASGTLGNGGRVLRMESMAGNIRIDRASAPTSH